MLTDALASLSRFAEGVLVPLCRDRSPTPSTAASTSGLDAALLPVAVGRKRLMVQARQLYVLSHAALLGDRSGAAAAERGYDFLLRRYRDERHGGWFFSVSSAGEVVDPAKDLYGHAFLLFALAWLHRAFAAPGALALAGDTMEAIRRHLALAEGGFQVAASRDWEPTAAALGQNPHMHLLEAVLALHEASGDGRWLAEADALVRLFRERLFDPATGTLGEHFGPGWRAHPEQGDAVEPGHHFEWVWLLAAYRDRGGAIPVASEAEALFRFALAHGLDAQHGGIHDQVSRRGTALLRTRRIWPVAEAVKACAAVTAAGGDARREARAFAAQLMDRFVPPGRSGWHETLTREGAPSMSELPGSTPYHLFLAAAEAARLRPDR